MSSAYWKGPIPQDSTVRPYLAPAGSDLSEHLANSICHILPHRAPTAWSRYGHPSHLCHILPHPATPCANYLVTLRSPKLHLPHPATPGANYMVTLRSPKQRFGRTQTSDADQLHSVPRAMGPTDVSNCKEPKATSWVTSTYVTCTKSQWRG